MSGSPFAQDPRIVLAEEDPAGRRLAERVLTRAGYDVAAVGDGPAALELLSRPNGPRLALLDWSMPGMTGPEICRQVRSLPDHHYVYLLLLTGRESKSTLVSGLEAGADDFLTRPWDADELTARVMAGRRIVELHDKLSHDAHHDPLTQLPNRGSFIRCLNESYERMRRDHAYLFGVLFIDLDGFKSVNDTLGHAAGDELLRQVARRMRSTLRANDTLARAADPTGTSMDDDPNAFVARLGGDEFTVLLNELKRDRDAATVAARLENEIAKPYSIGGKSVSITASIGIAVSTMPSGGPEELLQFADTAMYRAKAIGKTGGVHRELSLLSTR